MQQAFIRDDTMAVTVEGIDAFNEKMNEMVAEGWHIDHSIEVTPTSAGRFAYTTIFRKHPQQDEAGAAVLTDPEKERSIPTPFDDEIRVATQQVQKATDSLTKSSKAGELQKLFNQRQEWRYNMRENPDVAEAFGYES